KYYISNIIKNNIELLLHIEIVLHHIFLKKYETENTYNKFYNYISKLYKINKSKKQNNFTIIRSVLFYVPSPFLLAHTNPLFKMLENRKDLSIKIIIASRGKNEDFEKKCLESNVIFKNIDKGTNLETINNLANLSYDFDVVIWQSAPVHLGYFRSLNQNVCLWSFKFHPDIPGLLAYIGSFNEKDKIVYFNNNFWKNIDLGFEIRNKNKENKSWEQRKLKFGSFCREELINDKFFWSAVKIILRENPGAKFYYCGRNPIHEPWCVDLNIAKKDIIFLGWLADPHLKLKEMSFLIDGFSLGHGYMALEAMAASIPIIFPKNRKSYGTLENYLEKTISLFKVKNKTKYKKKYLLNFENDNELINLSKKLFYEKDFNSFYGIHYAKIISKLKSDNFEKFIKIIV
ncbi:glycosyltransferase family 4 protein, partial [bacterium]|nr:glycosyltransferase family 4 protein [bacterium]